MAAVYEIIRQRIGGLHLYAHSNGQGVDELIGGGCVERLEIAYGGNGRFAPTCLHFRRAVEEGTLLVEDYSNYQMTLRFLAGAMGLPFLPTRSGHGSDLLEHWGFSSKLRQKERRLAPHKFVPLDNPFAREESPPQPLVLVPAICPDVTIIHVQQADTAGTVRLEGLSFADLEQAKAARSLIVTCEEIVSPEELRAHPGQNSLPFFCVDALVHVPFGAYPTACWRWYDYDPWYLEEYARAARDKEQWRHHLERFVYGVEDHAALLRLVGDEHLQQIKADPQRGYAPHLPRR